MKDVAGNLYALSNNHVHGLSNSAPIGSTVLQPGRYDVACALNASDFLGTLSALIPIVFSTAAANKADAAIALVTGDELGNATPLNGYGLPMSTTTTAVPGMAVQKYGRTTGQTKGYVYAVNATVSVGYGEGTARFVDQIVVSSYSTKGDFLKSCDSGSGMVTDPGRQPVGLLFAGDNRGTTAIANHIDEVLSAFSASIDGE